MACFTIKTVFQHHTKTLNIKLIFIPSHLTDILQPLDVAIFAPLKSITNSKIKRLLIDPKKKTIGMPISVKFLQQAWKELSDSALDNAWEQYI